MQLYADDGRLGLDPGPRKAPVNCDVEICRYYSKGDTMALTAAAV